MSLILRIYTEVVIDEGEAKWLISFITRLNNPSCRYYFWSLRRGLSNIKNSRGSDQMLEYDVVVNGEVKETIKPPAQRLKQIDAFVKQQIQLLKLKHGSGIVVNRRVLY
jgi:hypothetical protein